MNFNIWLQRKTYRTVYLFQLNKDTKLRYTKGTDFQIRGILHSLKTISQSTKFLRNKRQKLVLLQICLDILKILKFIRSPNQRNLNYLQEGDRNCHKNGRNVCSPLYIHKALAIWTSNRHSDLLLSICLWRECSIQSNFFWA